TLQRFAPSIVVRESQEYAALVASERLGIRHARVGIIARVAETMVYQFAREPVDALAQSVGLASDPTGERLRCEPILTLFPAALDPAESEPAPVRRFRVARKPAAVLPDYWPGRSEPLVYLTLGTVTGGIEEMRSIYRFALDEVAGLPIRVL